MSKVTGTLNRWEVTSSKELDEYVIWGNLKEDPKGRFYDGQYIHTSGISVEDFPPEGLYEGAIVKTRNSTYLLGKRGNSM